MYSISAIGGQIDPNSNFVRRSRDLGLACQFAAHQQAHAQIPLASFVRLASNAQQVGQLKIYVNGYEECVGYVIWALLNPDVERDFISGRPRTLLDFEMSDGTSPWILDLAVAPGSLRHVLEDLRDVVFREHQQLTYFRVKGGRRVCKRITRQDRSSFMLAAQNGRAEA